VIARALEDYGSFETGGEGFFVNETAVVVIVAVRVSEGRGGGRRRNGGEVQYRSSFG